MKNHDVCLISESADSAQEIERYLRHLKTYFVRRHNMWNIDFTDPNASEMIIFDSQILTQVHYAALWRVAREFYQKPTLVVAREIQIALYRQIYALKNVATLQKPCNPDTFSTVLEKIRTGEEIKPSRCPRFVTDQPIRMMVLRTGLYLPSRMKNYSAGGAFVEYKGISLMVGDLLQVAFENQLESGKSPKQLNMPAKVIWIRTRQEVMERGHGVGVQFLQPLAEPPALHAM